MAAFHFHSLMSDLILNGILKPQKVTMTANL